MKPFTFATFSIVLMHGLCLLHVPNSFAEEVAIAVTQDDPTKVRDRVFAKCEVYGELEAIVTSSAKELGAFSKQSPCISASEKVAKVRGFISRVFLSFG